MAFEGIRVLALPLLVGAVLAGRTVADDPAGDDPASGHTIRIRTVPQGLVFDRPRFYVEAGKPVALVFENPDIMPHNLVIAAPGSLEAIGFAAERMAGTPDGLARGFIPADPRVLHAIRLIPPGEAARLAFTAPGEAGSYPFACTFPGHWRIMNGTMEVVRRLSDVPLKDRQPPAVSLFGARPFLRRWAADELLPELKDLDRDRSFARGKALFTAATCVECHKVRGLGGDVGPDLGAIPRKLAGKAMTRADVLRAVLEPSREIDPKYRTAIVETRDGAILTGIVVRRDADALHLLAGPRAKPIEVAIGDIASTIDSKVSMMPEGLLSTLSKEEVLDLLAFISTGGDPDHPSFAR